LNSKNITEQNNEILGPNEDEFDLDPKNTTYRVILTKNFVSQLFSDGLQSINDGFSNEGNYNELEDHLKKYTHNERHLKYYEANKQTIKEKAKSYMTKIKETNPEKLKEWRHNAYIKRKEKLNKMATDTNK
jgi:ketol-acid reductoisomerase